MCFRKFWEMFFGCKVRFERWCVFVGSNKFLLVDLYDLYTSVKEEIAGNMQQF